MKQQNKPICPDCKVDMCKSGKRWAAKGDQRQKWYCPQCGGKTETKITEGK